MGKRVIISAGGTGGHLFPAQALAEQLLDRDKDIEILFVAGRLSTNQYFDQTRYSYRDLPCGQLTLTGGINIFKGIIRARKILSDFSPDLVVGFGSYLTLPLLLAAKTKRIPIIVHEANSIPGKVNRLISPYSLATGVHFPSTKQYLKGNIVSVGMPLRKGFTTQKPSREEAANYFQLDRHRKTILVMGGSQGALAINHLILESLSLIKTTPIQIIHFTGKNTDIKKIQETYSNFGASHFVSHYEKNTEYAWALADVAVTRSGASSLAEQIAFSVPGVLIPYPHATDDHQKKNALYAQDIFNGLRMVPQETCTKEILASHIDDLLEDSFQVRQQEIEKDFCSLVLRTLQLSEASL